MHVLFLALRAKTQPLSLETTLNSKHFRGLITKSQWKSNHKMQTSQQIMSGSSAEPFTKGSQDNGKY